MKFLYLFIVVLYAQSSFAVGGDFSCPETHSEYTKVLSELKIFKDKLASNLGCKDISVEFDKLTSLLSGDQKVDFKSLVTSGAGGALSAESAEQVQKYASAVTEEVGTLISLIGRAASGEGSFWDIFTGTNKCSLEPEDEFEGIERLTKAAYEATNLVSRVAGPYGVPLQVGASAVYGIVEGLKSYSDRVEHINFDSFEKRQFFESAVCLMSKFDADIRKLNNPKGHLRRLEQARMQAVRVVDTVRVSCEGCDNNKMKFISTQVEKGKKNLKWIDDEIAKFNDIVNSKSGGIGPSELHSVSRKINKFLMGVAAPGFINWYSKKIHRKNKEVVKAVRAAQVSMFYDFKEMNVPWSRVLPREARGDQVLAVPEVADLYYMNLNYQNFLQIPDGAQLSPSFTSLLEEAYGEWKQSSFDIRIIQEYCEFFKKKIQGYHKVQKNCEALRYATEGLRTSYNAFYFADLINKNSQFKHLGPFDFRLDEYIEYIPYYAKLRNGDFIFANAGIDLEAVLGYDRSIRISDGRLDYKNKTIQGGNWWTSLEQNADRFILESESNR